MRILALVTDAYGGQGGIAKFNRDLLSALCSDSDVEKVVAIPRLIPEPPGGLPDKLEYVSNASGGKLRFALAVLRASVLGPSPSVIVCGHINLLPLAFLSRHLMRWKGTAYSGPRTVDSGKQTIKHAPRIVLIIHGIEAWQPTGRISADHLARQVDSVVAVSEFTREKFWSWARPKRARGFILPNCVDLAEFTPGPKSPELLERYGLRDSTVLLTVARLSAQERYKGIEEVLEVLPELSRTIPNLCYLIVGDGTDRARLVEKAKSLGLRVEDKAEGGKRKAESENASFGLAPRSSFPISASPETPRVIFHGWIPDADLPAHYRLGDAFVMPGRGEGFGIAYLEALACGVPAVASKTDASTEIAARCDRAIAVDPTDLNQIRSGILNVLELKRGMVAEGLSFYTNERFRERSKEIVKTCTIPRRNILVFRIGQLGDTIVALPSMWAVKDHFKGAHLTLLCDRHPDRTLVLGADLLRGAGIFDHFESYVVDDSRGGRFLRPGRMFELLRRLRRGRYDTLIYLAPSTRTAAQMERDRKFFSAAGIKQFVGMNGFAPIPRKIQGQPLGSTPAESDLLLARLAADGIPVPLTGKGSLKLGLGESEEAEVISWLESQSKDGGRAWLGIGPGSKMPAKRWEEKRFQAVVTELIKEFDVWPIVFGGTEDFELGKRLLGCWGRGYNAAGALSLRGAAAALKRCAFYLGNDTGTMHLAASVGVTCVPVFSAREWPGMWYPYGVDQKVFRSEIECDGCGLVECIERKNECLNRITVAEVLAGCRTVLGSIFAEMKGGGTKLKLGAAACTVSTQRP